MTERSSAPFGSGTAAPTTAPILERGASDCDADREALRQFLSDGSSSAFSLLTERYAGLVYGVARRRLGHHELAEEVTQDVFSLLARKASAVVKKPVPLPAWLHRAAVLQSSQAARRESTRQRAMKSLAAHHQITAPAVEPSPLGSLVTDLDEVLDELPQADRELLLARYFEQRSYGDLARRTGRTEAALMQHHHRALEKLTRFFQRRGHRMTVASLAGGLAAPLASAAPPGLAAACATHAIASTAAGVSIPKVLVLAFSMHSTSQFALLAVALCLLTGAGGFVAARQLTANKPGRPFSEIPAPTATGHRSSPNATAEGTAAPSPLSWSVPTAAEVLATEGHERLEKLALWLPGASPADMREMLKQLSITDDSSTTGAERELILQRWVGVDREGAFAACRLVQGYTWMACRAWGRLHPEQAAASMRSLDALERASVMSGIAEADPLLARDLLLSPDNQSQGLALSGEDDVAKALAKKNPVLALEYAWKNGLSSVPVVMAEWVRSDPDAAIAHVLGLTSLRQRSEATPALLLALFEKHPERIKPMIETMPEGRLKWQTMTDHVRALAASDEAAALSYVRDAASPVARAAMTEQLADSWAKSRPDQALALLRELDWGYSGDEYRQPDIVTPYAVGNHLGNTKAAIALSKLANEGHLDGAISIAEGVPPGPLRDGALDAIASGWPADRVYELSEWISTQESPTVRETGTHTIVRHLLAEKEPDFEAAARWASTLPEPTEVANSPVLEVMQRWQTAEPAAAAAAWDRLNVSDALRAALTTLKAP